MRIGDIDEYLKLFVTKDTRRLLEGKEEANSVLRHIEQVRSTMPKKTTVKFVFLKFCIFATICATVIIWNTDLTFFNNDSPDPIANRKLLNETFPPVKGREFQLEKIDTVQLRSTQNLFSFSVNSNADEISVWHSDSGMATGEYRKRTDGVWQYSQIEREAKTKTVLEQYAELRADYAQAKSKSNMDSFPEFQTWILLRGTHDTKSSDDWPSSPKGWHTVVNGSEETTKFRHIQFLNQEGRIVVSFPFPHSDIGVSQRFHPDLPLAFFSSYDNLSVWDMSSLTEIACFANEEKKRTIVNWKYDQEANRLAINLDNKIELYQLRIND